MRASFEASGGAYGSESVTADLRRGPGEPVSWRDLADGDTETPVIASEKVVRAIMAEEGLVARKTAEVRRRARYSSYRGELAERPANLPLREDGTHEFSAPELVARKTAEVRRKARYSSYRGELADRPANLPLRADGTHEFTAPEPGLLAVTDVSEFALDGFKAYLSPAIDCFDGWPVCWRLSLHPDKGLMVGMLGDLVDAVAPTAERPLVVHSDGGAVYMTDDWREACEAGHVVRSMSRKARSPDNARCEGFFGTLKSDFFDGRDWSGVTFEEFSERLDDYIEWYRSGKLKKSLGWKTIRQHRIDLGYAA